MGTTLLFRKVEVSLFLFQDPVLKPLSVNILRLVFLSPTLNEMGVGGRTLYFRGDTCVCKWGNCYGDSLACTSWVRAWQQETCILRISCRWIPSARVCKQGGRSPTCRSIPHIWRVVPRTIVPQDQAPEDSGVVRAQSCGTTAPAMSVSADQLDQLCWDS